MKTSETALPSSQRGRSQRYRWFVPGVLKIVLIINQKEDLIWESGGEKRLRTILHTLCLRFQ